MDSLSSFFTSMIINEISDKKQNTLINFNVYFITFCQKKNEHVKPKSTHGNRLHRFHDHSSMTSSMILKSDLGVSAVGDAS